MEAISVFFTDPLRLTLLAAAIVVLVGIFIFGRRGSRSAPGELTNDQISEALIRNDDENVIVKQDPLPSKLAQELIPQNTPVDDTQYRENTVGKDAIIEAEVQDVSTQNHDAEEDHFIVLHVVAPENKAFSGSAILEAMDNCQLVYGEYKIFHYPHPQDESLSLFSVVNMLKPGFFEKEKMNELATTGLSFFMRIPVMPGHHLDVFTTMLATAQNLSRQLGGNLMNESHLPLTQALVDEIKLKIKELEKHYSAIGEQAS